MGKTDFDIFPADSADQYYGDEQAVMESGRPLNREETVVNPRTGETRWLQTTKVPLRDKEGKIVGLMGISRDITARKQVEEALARERRLLRTLIDNLPDCIYAKDTACRKTLANPADLKNLHCETEAEAIGKTDFDLFPQDIAEKFYADDQKVIQGQPAINREEYFLDEEGRKRWLLTSKLPLRDENGEIVGLVGIGRDITERKRAEEALQNSEEKLRRFATQLERSNRELQDFAYVASHDLQEPLRKIVVFGERLREKCGGNLDAEAGDCLERMQKAASRMQNLINELLTFSRVTTKARPFEPVDLAKVADDVMSDLEGRIELVKGRVEVGTLPVIDAEALQMRQLLQNLIGNALKFHRPDFPPVVKVGAQIVSGRPPQAEPGAPVEKLCRLTVSDNGIGFDEKYLDRIFNVFQRLHSRSEYEGTGMGLAIARKIAVFHRGDITAKSKPGLGATFIVTLPVTHPKETHNGEHNQ
jgi:PAS domain S-box-containing protein